MGLQRAGGCVLSLFLIGLLPGCAAEQGALAQHAKDGLLGLSTTDMRMCAGHPHSIAPSDDGEIWMYERGATPPGGIVWPALELPWGGASIGGVARGYCRVQLHFVGGRVAEVEYAGATDLWGARDAVCAPIVRTCVERRTHTARR